MSVLAVEIDDVLETCGPNTARLAMFRKRCKALANMKRTKMTEAAREKKARKLILKYPALYTSNLEVKEELFASFKDPQELVRSLPFSRSSIRVPVHQCVNRSKRSKRSRELLIDDALKVLQTVLYAD